MVAPAYSEMAKAVLQAQFPDRHVDDFELSPTHNTARKTTSTNSSTGSKYGGSYASEDAITADSHQASEGIMCRDKTRTVSQNGSEGLHRARQALKKGQPLNGAIVTERSCYLHCRLLCVQGYRFDTNIWEAYQAAKQGATTGRSKQG
jgi:hypothetical protein